MTEQQIYEMRQAVNALEMGSMNYHNYDTSQDYHGNEASALGYDPDLEYDDGTYLNAMGRYIPRQTMEPKGQITYDLQINYLDGGGGLGNPVNVTLFQLIFNEGTFVGNDLVFTNGTLDTATVVGITSPFRAIMERSQTEPFNINFVRMNPVAAPQFNTKWRFDDQSVWGGGKFNNLTPKTFITPLQFQLLRVDVPINYGIDSDSGFSFDVLSSEVIGLGGLQMTLFIDKILNPTRAMKGKPAVQSLTGRGIMAQMAASADPIQNARTLVALENAKHSGLPPKV